jgi:succinate dehydrogenase / fumarate reductase membrane anchor subunit
LGKALGRGSAREGTQDWWVQRLTAVALVPLSLWFAMSLISMQNLAFWQVRPWVAEPMHGILLILLVLTLLYHSDLGVRVVVEDYVHHGAVKVAILVLLKFLHVALAVGAVYAVVSITAGVSA